MELAFKPIHITFRPILEMSQNMHRVVAAEGPALVTMVRPS